MSSLSTDDPLGPGGRVRVVAGPFENFEGIVDARQPDDGRVRVIVTVFGRQTPIEVERRQVEPIE